VSQIDAYAGGALARKLFWVAALFALAMALYPHGVRLPGDPSDRIQHALAFATLGLLGGLAYPRLSTSRLIIALALFGAFIEIAQAIPVLHRDCDFLDWLTDLAASVAAVVPLRAWLVPTR